MDDMLYCPICNNKLRTIGLPNHRLYLLDGYKTSDYAQRLCSKGHSHVIIFWTDKKTKKIDLIKLSLDTSYTRIAEIDQVNEKSRIICSKNFDRQVIDINRLLIPDFPLLTEIKRIVNLFVVCS